jgi:hypothetical protein
MRPIAAKVCCAELHERVDDAIPEPSFDVVLEGGLGDGSMLAMSQDSLTVTARNARW